MGQVAHHVRTIARIACCVALLFALNAPAWAAPEEACGACPEPPPCDCYDCCTCREAKDPPCPAPYDNRRFQENWRPCLCIPPCDRGDWTDAWKAVALTQNKTIWANFGGQARLRFESFENQGFGAAGDDADDSWTLLRLRAHADVHFGQHARIYAEGIFADQWTRELGERPIDVNQGDLLNLFGEVMGPVGGLSTAGVWGGRHELQFGKQRLVGPLDWANTRRTFQGGGGWYKRGFHTVEGFVVRPVVIEPDSFDDDWNDDITFWGLTYKNAVQTCITWEAYLFGLHRDAGTYAGVTDDEDRYTLAALAYGEIPGTRLDYDTAAGYQFGSFGDGDISAGFVALELGWKPCAPCWEPRFALAFDWSSGDDDPLDADVGTFNQLFPTGHKWYGANDLLGRQNLIALKAEASAKPTSKLTAKAQAHAFWRADDNDAAYNVAGGVLRAPGGSDETYLGWSIDLLLKYKIDRHWLLVAGYSHFFTGDFFEETGADDDVDFFFLSAQVTF
ncbi:MAG: alginate export family protein [Planctomycetota bacterium]|nr:alginate export family protein [Planctomycetota bacterium]